VILRLPRYLAILAGLALGVSLAPESTAFAQASVAASCPGSRSAGTAAPADGRLAQVFTARRGGALTSAQLDVTKNAGNADWIVRIATVGATGPTNSVLASAIVPDATVPMSDSTMISATFSSPPPVVVGQRYALVLARPGSGAGSLQVGTQGGDICEGQLFFSNTQTDAFSSAGPFDMVFTVFVEPRPDTDPPKTTIIKKPPNRDDRSKVKFKFTSNEPGSTFECMIDKKLFKPCTSPKKFKVRDGNHTFLVRAIDAAGNVDASPDKDKFRVVD
jgi:hypothetical protein